MDQLSTWQQEADEELEAVRPAIIQRASAIADYTDTSAFAPEVEDDGIAQPEEWFGLNPADGVVIPWRLHSSSSSAKFRQYLCMHTRGVSSSIPSSMGSSEHV